MPKMIKIIFLTNIPIWILQHCEYYGRPRYCETYQTPQVLDKLPDQNLTPLSMHPRMTYIANTPLLQSDKTASSVFPSALSVAHDPKQNRYKALIQHREIKTVYAWNEMITEIKCIVLCPGYVKLKQTMESCTILVHWINTIINHNPSVILNTLVKAI